MSPTSEEVLRRLCSELFGGDWDELVSVFLRRLEGKPEVPKLTMKIEMDLDRISQLRGGE